jgi:uncharacterized protein YjaG (DUF416 family)
MTQAITSFDDYAMHLTKKLRALRHFDRCIFSAWCAEHLLATRAELVESKFSASDLQALREILDVIWELLLDGSIPETDVLNQLDMQFMEIDADDPFAVHPVASSVNGAIGLCMLGCRRNDVGLAVQAGADVVRILDFELDDKDCDGSENSLFEHPEVKRELEVQLAMIKHLQGDYDLDASLRSALRK